MTVMITGGAGYVGGHVAMSLMDNGENVIVIDDCSIHPPEQVPEGAKLVKGSIGDCELVAETIRKHDIRDVIHFAALIRPDESVQRPLDYYRINTLHTHTLLSACLTGGVDCFVFSSSAAVYGAAGLKPVAEDAPLQPVSPYGASKMMAEHIIRDVGRANPIKTASLRYFNVAGADPSGRRGQVSDSATHLIKVACEAATGKRDHIAIHGTDYPTPDGTGIRDYIHIQDLARAHCLTLDWLREGRGGDDGAVFNCGAEQGVSVLQVLDAVDRMAKKPVKRQNAPRRDGDPAALVADCARIRKVLGFRPECSDIDSIVKSALMWEKTLK